MAKFILQFLVVFLFWKSNAKVKGTKLTPSSFLIGIYLLSSVCAIVLLLIDHDYTYPFKKECWLPLMEFLTFILLFLFPFKWFDETKQDTLRFPSLSVMNTFSTILICLSLFSIGFYARNVVEIFASGNVGALRQMLYGGEGLVEASIFNTIASVSSSMYVFVLLCFFVYTAIGGHKTRRLFLLIASFSEPIHILSYVGRDGIVFWIFTFVFLFLFFAPYLDSDSIKKLRKRFIYGAAILMVPFLLISVSRFGSSEEGTTSSLVGYMGQSFVNGPLFFSIDKASVPYSDGRAFPLFLQLMGKTPPVGERELYAINDWISWGFGTFLVALYRNLHLTGLIITSLCFNVIFYFVMKSRKKKINLSDLFIYLLYFQIIGEGVFYFKHSGPGGNLFIIMSIVCYLGFKLIENNDNPIIISRMSNDISQVLLKR